MTIPINRGVNEQVLQVRFANINSAGSVYVPCAFRGRVVAIYSVIDGSFTVANVTLTPSVNGGTAMTNGAVTVVQSGSAAGQVNSSAPTGLNFVNEGDYIKITTNAAGTGAVAAEIAIVVRR